MPLSLRDWGVVIRENGAGGPPKGNPVAVKEQIKVTRSVQSQRVSSGSRTRERPGASPHYSGVGQR